MGSTTGVLREMDEQELFGALHGAYPRDEVQAEIRRRELEGLPDGVAEVLTWKDRFPAFKLLEVSSAVFRVTTDYADGPAWDHHGSVVLRNGERVPVNFWGSGVADALVELSEHAGRILDPDDTLTVDLTGCVVLRPMVLTFEADGEPCEVQGPACEVVRDLAKVRQDMAYGHCDVHNPKVFRLGANGERVPLEVRVEGAGEYDSNDMSYPRVTVTWPDGKSVEAGYSVDGRS